MTEIKIGIGQTKVPAEVYKSYIKLCAELSSNRRVAGTKKFTQSDFIAKCIEKFTKNPDKFLKDINYDND